MPFPMSLLLLGSAGALTLLSLHRFSRKEHKKSLGSHGPASGETVVTYFFCGEEIPYRRTMSSHSLTLGHFKEQLRKKGNYRWVQRQLCGGNACSVHSSGWRGPR